MNVSVSLSDEDVDFLDRYAVAHGYPSWSAVVHRAVGLLRAVALADDYAAAWRRWESTGEAQL